MEQLTRHPTYDSQHDLLVQYCSEAEAALRNAVTRAHVEHIREELCARFESACDSGIITSGTRNYINRLIDTLWPKGPAHEHREGHSD